MRQMRPIARTRKRHRLETQMRARCIDYQRGVYASVTHTPIHSTVIVFTRFELRGRNKVRVESLVKGVERANV